MLPRPSQRATLIQDSSGPSMHALQPRLGGEATVALPLLVPCWSLSSGLRAVQTKASNSSRGWRWAHLEPQSGKDGVHAANALPLAQTQIGGPSGDSHTVVVVVIASLAAGLAAAVFSSILPTD